VFKLVVLHDVEHFLLDLHLDLTILIITLGSGRDIGRIVNGPNDSRDRCRTFPFNHLGPRLKFDLSFKPLNLRRILNEARAKRESQKN